jgi:NAD(P)-dependent dehydrogenase (short-subunit alcohol dehydrogenase family)
MITSPPSVTLVTGISSGIGRATAALMAAKGHRVYGSVRAIKPEVELAGVTLVQLDVRDKNSIQQAVQSVLKREQRIDVVVNNAGIALAGTVEETDIAQAQSLFDVNFFGVARVIQAVLPSMRQRRSGRIINIGSALGYVPGPFRAYYCASKHALEGYTESLDHEIRSFGVRAILVDPNFTRTQLKTNAIFVPGTVSDYDNMRARVVKAVTTFLDHGMDSEEVARVVGRAVQAKNPKVRYPAGRNAIVLWRSRRLLPTLLFDRRLRSQFRLDSRN